MNGKSSKQGITTVEVAIVIVVLVFSTILMVPLVTRAKEAARRGGCQGNLKTIGTALRLYAAEHEGYFPNAHYARGENCDAYGLDFMWQGDQVVPDYLTDATVNICPSDPDGAEFLAKGGWRVDRNPNGIFAPCAIDARSYTYYSWTFSQETYTQPGSDPNSPDIVDAASLMKVINPMAVQTATALGDAMERAKSREEAQEIANRDLVIPGATAFRTRLGIEQTLFPGATDKATSEANQAKILLQNDTISPRPDDANHMPAGVNGLYMAGHVEFITFPGKFPAQRAWYILMGEV